MAVSGLVTRKTVNFYLLSIWCCAIIKYNRKDFYQKSGNFPLFLVYIRGFEMTCDIDD